MRKLLLFFSYVLFFSCGRSTDSSADIYLFTYDKDFILTGETEIEGMDFLPLNGFTKDNKLYLQWVVDENPAFIFYSYNF